MPERPCLSIRDHFASLPDPRVDRTKRHELFDIITIALCAIICGADSWVDVALFGNVKCPWLRTFLALPNGIPSHDTCGRVFTALDPTRYGAVETFFNEARASDFRDTPHGDLKMVDGAHGRVEIRQYWTTTDPELLVYLDPTHAWAGLDCVGMVERERRTDTQTTREMSYDLSSLDGIVTTCARAVRSHWGIENRLHRVLDIAFREDESRVRARHVPENLTVLHHIALNLLRQDRATRAGVKARRLTAGWDEAYLLSVLAG